MVLFSNVRPFYFVTFNTATRMPVLANAEVHDAFLSYATRGQNDHDIAVGNYVVMPDHLHVFICLPEHGIRLTRWVAGLKRALSAALKTRGVSAPHWQEGFFDHVLRNAASYGEKWHYVRNNPVRKSLCATADEWP